ncbi:aspartic proteinase CDR1-like [Andrographis paniculata]|uniref:aspartic proteinase CDR1-like n=1 Tax=Andrographis paniculata TaxID=175694 RepID=UPI0021E84E4C|nr:aspartic proteinase CDR1-like [Andrographis paniculata]
MAIIIKPYNKTIPYFYFALISILSIFRVSLVITNAAIITFDLIPRDLLFNSSLTPSERLRNSLLRSSRRAEFLAGASNFSRHELAAAATTDIVYDRSEYFMKFSIGTPPVEFLAMADTGSPLTWIQCAPCVNCYHQTQPLFDRSRSSSYRRVPFESETCRSTHAPPGVQTFLARNGGGSHTCGYSIRYQDDTTSSGELAAERLAVGELSIPNFVFGCGTDNRGAFSDGSAGMVGLSGGSTSMINQLGSSIRGKFAYCLPEASFHAEPEMGKMSFGGGVPGRRVVSTPIVMQTRSPLYYLTMEGITVGNRRLNWGSSSRSIDEGNIAIDIGTTTTTLPPELFEQVAAAVKRKVKLKTKADPHGFFSDCFEVNRLDDYKKLPKLIVHFRGGADVKLSRHNAFMDSGRKTVCLAFVKETGNLPIYGSTAQANFIVGYDLETMTVSFKKSPCSEWRL